MAWTEGAGVGVGAFNKMPRYFHRAASSLYIEHKSPARLQGGVGRCSRSSHTDVYAPGAVLRPPPPQSRSLRFLSLCITTRRSDHVQILPEFLSSIHLHHLIRIRNRRCVRPNRV